LARSLNAIICQRLIPVLFNKRIPCLEIMKHNAGTQEAIARNDLHLLTGHIEASVNEGMHSFDQYVMQLVKSEYVTLEHPALCSQLESSGYGEPWALQPAMPGILKPDPEA